MKKYIEIKSEIFEIENCKNTDLPHQPGTYFETSEKIIEPKLFQSLIGTLLFASRTCRPDIAWAVNRLSVFAANPGIEHLRQAKKVLKYLFHTREYGIWFPRKENRNMVTLFVDASWKNVPADLSTIDGHVILWNDAPILWKRKRQNLVAQSSTEAETVALARGVCNLKWMLNVVNFLEIKNIDIGIKCDNQGTIKLMSGQTISGMSRHIEVKYFFTRVVLKKNSWTIDYVDGKQNLADIFTKPVARETFIRIRNCLIKKL
eukprot:snap_masked-scaffold_57-processed-gene-1.54-mRNA-1 protein AED:0.26 eAED:0.26 QI:0/-1/0/1/-1/1/1/0/260